MSSGSAFLLSEKRCAFWKPRVSSRCAAATSAGPSCTGHSPKQPLSCWVWCCRRTTLFSGTWPPAPDCRTGLRRLCAEQPDRLAIAQLLHSLNNEARSHEAEASEFNPKARQFHDALALSCGNGTMREVVGTLESLWSDYVSRMTDTSTASEGYPTIEKREEVIVAHDVLAEAIAAGDADAAEIQSRRHLEETQRFLLDSAADEPIAITRLRGSLSPLGPRRLALR